MRKWSRVGAWLIGFGALLAASACGGDGNDGGKTATAPPTREISVQDAWARNTAMPPPQAGGMQDVTPGGMAAGDRGAAYMVIKNTGTVDDALIGAESTVAAATEVHESVISGDTVTMRPVPRIELKAGDTLELQPGGYHIMLIGLNEPLVAGTTFTVTLKFEQAGSIPVTVDVRAQ
ncbi:MAG: copper chaperone PCu(A)C [Dehalococcoidia bacterium]|nr:MAG: copper chaperone PCu(A)C [Dehalococcoidia bacterium]